MKKINYYILLLVCCINQNIYGQSIKQENEGISRTVIDIGSYSKPFSYMDMQNTELTADTYRPSDWMWDDSPNDIFYRFTLETPMLLQVGCAFVNLGEPGNIYVVKEDLDSKNLIPITTQKQDEIIEVFLLPGTYYCIVEGLVDDDGWCHNGDVLTIIASITNRKEINLGVLGNNTSQVVTGDTREASNAYGGIYNDIFYKFKLTDASDISATLLNSGIKDVNIYILDSKQQQVAASQSSLLNAVHLTAGEYYLVIEGMNGDGIISINIETKSVLKIDIGTYSKAFSYFDIQDTQLTPDAYRPPNWIWENSPNDVFYRITCEVPMTVQVNSALLEGGRRSNVYIVKEDRNTNTLVPVNTQDVNGEKYAVLHKGIYYVIVEGCFNQNSTVYNGQIATFIRGIPYNTEVDLGIFTGDHSQTVTYDTRNAVNSYGGIYNDVFYKFELNSIMDFSASLVETEVGNVNLYLINTKGDIVQSSQDTQLSLKQLSAGIYYLVVEGERENGIISVNIETKSLSKLVFDLGTYSEYFMYSHTQDTRITPDSYRPLDWIWEDSPNDVFYKFTLDTPMLIIASNYWDSKGSNAYIVEENMNTGELTPVEIIYKENRLVAAMLAKGTYNIISEGTIDNNGTILNGEIETSILGVPHRMEVDLGAFDGGAIQVISGDTRRTSNEYGDESRNDIYYKFELGRQMNISVSPDDSGLNEVNIYLLDEDENQVANSQNNILRTERLPLGVYYLVVEGKNKDGILSLNLEVGTPNIVRDLGEISGSRNFSETFDTYKSDNWFGLPYGEVFYKFQLTRQMEVSIRSHSLDGNTDEFATVIYLLDESENVIQSSQDGKTGLTLKNVLPGTYHVVSEGKTRDMSITTEISTIYYDIDLGNSNNNYILTRTYTEECGADYRINIDYFDGLGRPSGTVRIGASPLGKDIITRQDYDNFGRKSREWLPRVSEYSNGKPITPTEFEHLSSDIYGNDSYLYSKIIYESSPLDRVFEQYGPGADWHNNNRPVATAYKTNIPDDTILNCKLYRVGGTSQKPTLIQNGNYAIGQLFVTELKNEDGNTSYEFKDKLGQVVLTRQMAGDVAHDTYYVYNDFGMQCFVLPPQMDDKDVTQARLDELAYQYKYDARNRCIAKKIPGADWNYYVYDKADRLIFTQDGNQRQAGEWSFSIPDVFDRIVLTGICTNTLEYSSSPLATSTVKGAWNDTTSPMKGYTVTGITLTNPVVLSANYYDSYDFMGKNGIPDSTTVAGKNEQEQDGFGKRYMESSQGLLTGTLTAQLTEQDSQSSYLYSVMYYDCNDRLVQTKSANHLPGGIEKDFFAYNFEGKTVRHKHIHSATGKASQTEVYNYTYDHAGRLLTTTHQLNEGADVTLVDNEYDELGRLSSNKRNGQINLKTAYAYNIRSWTKSISNSLFSQNLHYTNGIGTPCYNGNISSMNWKTSADTDIRGYYFEYDPLSRLKNAVYGEGEGLSMNTDRFSEQITGYDKNGNILELKRYGQTSVNSYGLIDNLAITLNGNQLKSVDDSVSTPVFGDGFDFKDGTKQGIEYFYDANGNLSKDLNKKITGIQYNYLNLPNRIEFENGNYISYLYDAAGKKRRVVHNIAGNTTTTDYCGNAIYENGIPKTLLTEAGYVSLTDSKYHYFLQDHQGNNRVIASQDGTIEELNHYYPFGGVFASISSVQPYKYNGKELDRKGGLDWYDYGARHYDANLGRWHAVDPMTEEDYSLSPYNYCLNNPFKLIDPNGMWPGNPLLQPFGRYQYGSNAAVNSFKFIHNTVAAVVNTPINIINQLADETGYIYNNGVGSYLSSGTKNIGDAVSSELSYRVNTPISQQAADTWQAMKDPQNWENATATAALMLSPMKGSGTVGATQTVSAVTNGGTKTVYRVFGGDSRAQGFSWTPINPQKVSNYRNKAGLPSGGESGFNNTADFMIKGEVKTQNVIKKRAALPLDGNKGGLPEYIINPEHVNITNFTVLKP